MKTVVVKFTSRYSTGHSSQEYHYIVDADTKVQVGDFAVVHNGSEFAIVQVVDVKAGASSKASKSLVTILTKEVFEAYKAENERIKEQRQLFQRLEQLLAQESENNKYRLLAQSNAEAAEILAKLGIK